MPGINSKHWGRSTWAVLHTLAAKIGDADSGHLFCVVCLLRYNMPCSVCRAHFHELLQTPESGADQLAARVSSGSTHPLDQKTVKSWLIHLHNKVSVRLGRPWLSMVPNYEALALDVPGRFDPHVFTFLTATLLDNALHPGEFELRRVELMLKHLGHAMQAVDAGLAGLCGRLATEGGTAPAAAYRAKLEMVLDHFIDKRPQPDKALHARMVEVREVYRQASLVGSGRRPAFRR